MLCWFGIYRPIALKLKTQEPNDQRVLDQTILDIVNLLSTFKSLDFEKENSIQILLQSSLEVNLKYLVILVKADMLGRVCQYQQKYYLKFNYFKSFVSNSIALVNQILLV